MRGSGCLHFRYVLQPAARPVCSLGGRHVRPRPIVPVTIIGPAGYRTRDAKLDTAADDTVFPEFLAAFVGVDLTNAPLGEAAGLAGQPIPVRYAQVELRLTDGAEDRRWLAWVSFGQVVRPLLGFAGCLQFFTATFEGDLEQVELSVNSLYSGS
jgi:hypothetical protein